jgi:hypothetical protein
MNEPLHAEPTVDEILSDEIVQAMMAADRVDRDALRAMLTMVAQNLTMGACSQPPDKLVDVAAGWQETGVTGSSIGGGSPG